MAPEPNTPAAQPTGTPPPATPPAQGAAPTEQQQEQAVPLTVEVVREIVGQAVEAAVRRTNQSLRAREANIQNQVKAIQDQLTKLNVPVTPEMADKIQEQAIAAVDAQTQQPNQPQDPTEQTPTEAPGPGNPVFEWTQAFYKEIGTEVLPTDPEYNEIKTVLDDPTGTWVKYQTTVMNAAQKKSARVSQQRQNADARTLEGGQRSTPAAAGSARELFARAHEKDRQ